MEKIIESSFVGQLHNQIMQELTKMANFPNYNRNQVYDTGKTVVEEYYSTQELGQPEVLSFQDFDTNVDKVLSYAPENYTDFFQELKDEDKINQRQLGINSSYYWYVANTNGDSPWEDVPGKPAWWVRGLRHLGGFCAGFLVGSAISGGNALVGIACGTVTGGGCSAAE